MTGTEICGSERPGSEILGRETAGVKIQGEIEGTKNLGEKCVEDNLRERNFGGKITKVSRKEMGLNHVKGI